MILDRILLVIEFLTSLRPTKMIPVAMATACSISNLLLRLGVWALLDMLHQISAHPSWQSVGDGRRSGAFLATYWWDGIRTNLEVS